MDDSFQRAWSTADGIGNEASEQAISVLFSGPFAELTAGIAAEWPENWRAARVAQQKVAGGGGISLRTRLTATS